MTSLERQALAFQKVLTREVALIRAQARDGVPDWPWAFGFALGPAIPAWDEQVNPA